MKTIRLKNKQIDYPILIGSNLYKDIGKICKKYLEKNLAPILLIIKHM